MFPLNWNIPFIRKNGSRTTLGAITGDIAGIEEDIAGVKEDVIDLTDKADGILDNIKENGSLNILPNYGASTTISPVTFTVNADKTVTASATTATSSVCNFDVTRTADSFKLKAGTYKLTGCPEGGKIPSGSNDTYAVECYNVTTNSRIGWEIGNGFEFTLAEESVINIVISIRNGYNIDGSLVFKPMISDPALKLSYDDYVPYAKTNRELTEEITTIDHYVSGEVIVGDSVPIGCSNASGTEIYLAIPLPKRVLSAVTVSTSTINLSWARADGSSITTGLTVNRVNLSRPNVLGVTIGGTFTPLTLYAVSLNIANVTIP